MGAMFVVAVWVDVHGVDIESPVKRKRTGWDNVAAAGDPAAQKRQASE